MGDSFLTTSIKAVKLNYQVQQIISYSQRNTEKANSCIKLI